MATHLLGIKNTLADVVSRGALSTLELSIDLASLQSVFEAWGTPTIDAFATAKNKKCLLFCLRGNWVPRSLTDVFLLD